MSFRKQRVTAKIDNHELECQNAEELLGIDIDSTITSFINYINRICKKANQKLNALARIPRKEESNSESFYYIKSWLMPSSLDVVWSRSQ